MTDRGQPLDHPGAAPARFDLPPPPRVVYCEECERARRDDRLAREDEALLERWRAALVARDDAEVERLVATSRVERAQHTSPAFDDDTLLGHERAEFTQR